MFEDEQHMSFSKQGTKRYEQRYEKSPFLNERAGHYHKSYMKTSLTVNLDQRVDRSKGCIVGTPLSASF
jgi:hypothetical protein